MRRFLQCAIAVVAIALSAFAQPLELTKLTASDGIARDQFGCSVAIQGNIVVVGACSVSQTREAVYVFEKSSSGWGPMTQIAKLTPSTTLSRATFGGSIAIDQDTIVVGAPRALVGSTLNGAAYVFVKPAGGWRDANETAKLTASDGQQFASHGLAVAVSGDTVVVGATGGSPFAPLAGAAYVYVMKPNGGWVDATESAKLTASDGVIDDALGLAVGIAGDTIAAGAPLHNQRQGAVYLFSEPTGGWTTMTETAKLVASDGDFRDLMGRSLDLTPNALVAGAPLKDNAAFETGAAYVFERSPGGWQSGTEVAKLTASVRRRDDQFGWSVQITPDTIAVGAPEASSVFVDTGVAYVFPKPAAGWTSTTEAAMIIASDVAPNDEYARSIGLDHDTLVCGALANASLQGAAYVVSLANIRASGSTSPGGTRTLALSAIGDGGLAYRLASSLGTGPIPIDTRELPLTLDPLFVTSAFGFAPTVFVDYFGVLDAQGAATAMLNLPSEPALVGQILHSAFLTLDATRPSGVKSLSSVSSFTVTP